MTSAGPISHISDTARWVALHSAMESERPDALFHDPYARRLAGDRGEEIVRSLPGREGGPGR
jgi:O-methyltransferase involved in polyketide biosynthesis